MKSLESPAFLFQVLSLTSELKSLHFVFITEVEMSATGGTVAQCIPIRILMFFNSVFIDDSDIHFHSCLCFTKVTSFVD
jgi:hypothetical protein